MRGIRTGSDDPHADGPIMTELKIDERIQHRMTHHLPVEGLTTFDDPEANRSDAIWVLECALGGQWHLEGPRHPSW